VPPQWGVSSIGHHDCVFPGERCCITPARVSIKLRTPGEGHRGHVAPHHSVTLELVPDGVCVVWAGFLEEPLEVVCKRPHLMLVTVNGGQDMPHTGVARLPVTAVVMVGHHRGPLRVLLAPLFAALDALLSVMDSDIRWHLLTATWGHLPTSLG
jgi:hypothetical protein